MPHRVERVAGHEARHPLSGRSSSSAAFILADGFHRCHAHNALKHDSIAVDVREGAWIDALRYSLSANATHGKRRSGADYAKAYRTACDNDLTTATDVDGVRALLHCSTRPPMT
jgi:hypothetical protein